MVNHWIKRINRREKLEEARQALQKWCNKTAYDDFGMYDNKLINWDKPMDAKKKFFEKHPEYQEFDMELRVTWNMYREDYSVGNSVTGIPEVRIYPNKHWNHCAEIAKKAALDVSHFGAMFEWWHGKRRK